MSMSNPIRRLFEYKYAFATDMKQIRKDNIVLKLLGFIKFIFTNRVVFYNNSDDPELIVAKQFQKVTENSKIDINNTYVYPWDVNSIRFVSPEYYQIASVTADYSWMITHPLKDKLKELSQLKDSNFKESLFITLDSIHSLIKRISQKLNKGVSGRQKVLAGYFGRFWDFPAATFDEAVQRILFFNALFWQNKHRQNGIGRLDMWLGSYFDNDLKNDIITRDKAKNLLRQAILILGKDQRAKSNSEFPGDTGQVILLGGIVEDGSTVENEVTHIILEIFEENPVPDPKLILRINKHTSNSIWEKAIASILKGSGSPLIMNEDVIIPRMINFGYDATDVWNLGTSACWEPLIIGKSLDQNNCIPNIPVLKALNNALQQDDNDTFEQFLKNVENQIFIIIESWDLSVKFDYSPLMSLFFEDCIKKSKDFTKGGARYNYHGLLIVGFPNLINSLLNIKQYVYEKGIVSIKECKECIADNFKGREDLLKLFRSNRQSFGSSVSEVIELTNNLMNVIGDAVSKRTMFGEKIKVGFSSPGYIGLAKNFPASLDGRKFGDPFAVHISPISSEIDISEILDFASKLEYDSNRINGNVVDFIIPSSYAKQKNKLGSIIKTACDMGLFELQLNVQDKKTLISAKKHPEKYPNLIVRVWGFSAYFNDLPEEYKNNLIERAEMYHAY